MKKQTRELSNSPKVNIATRWVGLELELGSDSEIEVFPYGHEFPSAYHGPVSLQVVLSTFHLIHPINYRDRHIIIPIWQKKFSLREEKHFSWGPIGRYEIQTRNFVSLPTISHRMEGRFGKTEECWHVLPLLINELQCYSLTKKKLCKIYFVKTYIITLLVISLKIFSSLYL